MADITYHFAAEANRHEGFSSCPGRSVFLRLKRTGSRIQVRVQLKPVDERERFAQMIQHVLKTAGCSHTLLADSGLELLRLASQGQPRQAGRILRAAMQRAVPRGLNHLPDDLLQETIEELR